MKMNLKIVIMGTLVLLFCSVFRVSSEEVMVYKKEGAPVKGSFVKGDPNGDLWVMQGQVRVKVKASDYSYARLADKPKDIDAAEKLLAAKNYEKAASDFAGLYTKYKSVGYDVFCVFGEASALVGLGKKNDAINRLKILDKYELVDQDKETEFYESRKLLSTLCIEESKFADALAILADLGQSNDDDVAAFGFNSRGDILLKQDKKRDAVLMFMRTALLFPVENKERARALLMVANVLTDMQDNRGKVFLDMLKSDYPNSALINELK